MNTTVKRYRLQRALTALGISMAVILAPQAALAQDSPDLEQTVNADEVISEENAIIDRGHVDIGPRFVDGNWTVMARNDAAETPTWHAIDDIVIHVKNAALLPTPQDDAFDFMSASEQWYVIPQTENPAVAWLGWNTQDPEVTKSVSRGVTMTLGPVDGPGESFLFLQDGTFGEPRILMDGQDGKMHDIWVDVNTHVHANWAFSEPGIYRAPVTFNAETTDGQKLTHTSTLRFAVGDETDPEDALNAPSLVVASTPTQQGNSDAQADSSAPSDGEYGIGIIPTFLIAIALVVVAAVVGLVIFLSARRSAADARRAKAEAQERRHAEADKDGQV